MKTPSPRRILFTQHGLCRRNEHTAAQTGSCSSAGSVRCTARRPPRTTFRSDPKGPVLRRKEGREQREKPFATRTKWSQNQPPVLVRRCDATLRCSLRLLRLGTYHHTASPAHPSLPDGTGGLLLGQQEGKGGKGEEGESECRRRLADNCF